MPAPLIRRIVSENSGPLRPWEMSILLAATLGTNLIPIYWLWPNPWLLALYILCVGGYTLMLALHICKKCRVEVCPLNRYRPTNQE